jgi:hypothetical protein
VIEVDAFHDLILLKLRNTGVSVPERRRYNRDDVLRLS